jgi:hypothetical protein
VLVRSHPLPFPPHPPLLLSILPSPSVAMSGKYLLFSILLVLLVVPGSFVWGQSYVPQFPAFKTCPPNQRLVTVGYPNATNHTTFIYPVDSIWGSEFVYVTPFTLRGQNAFGTVLYQVSLAVGENRNHFLPTRFRIAIYLLQEAEKKITGFNEASMIAQTDEITLYPSAAQVIYANLIKPVMLESEGDYGLGIWSDGYITLPGGRYGSGFTGIPQFRDLSYGYNDYSAPEGTILYAGDKIRPIAATGCLDSSSFNQPNQTVYAFCALIETSALTHISPSPHRPSPSHSTPSPFSHLSSPLSSPPSAVTSVSRTTTRTSRSPP